MALGSSNDGGRTFQESPSNKLSWVHTSPQRRLHRMAQWNLHLFCRSVETALPPVTVRYAIPRGRPDMNILRLLTVTNTILFSSAFLVAQGPPGAGARPVMPTRPSVILNAPEINPALIGGALTLLIGGLLILTDSLRRKSRTV